jgi:hypothetical protein
LLTCEVERSRQFTSNPADAFYILTISVLLPVYRAMLDALGFSWEVPAAPRGRARSKTTTAMPVAAVGGGGNSAMKGGADASAAGGVADQSTVAVSNNAVAKRRYTRKAKTDPAHSSAGAEGPPQRNDQTTGLPVEPPRAYDIRPLAEDTGNEEDVDEEMLKLLDPEIQKEVRLCVLLVLC